MNRDELVNIVKQSKSDTLIACRLREVLGLPKLAQRGRLRHEHRGQRKKYRGIEDCRRQKHGVRL